MSLESIYYIGQTVAVIAILISLVAIYFQMRQTIRHTRAELSLASWNHAQDVQSSFYTTDEDSDFMNRALFGEAPLTDAEKTRLGIRMVTMVSTIEGMHFLKERNLIERGAYERAMASMTFYFRSARVRKWWRRSRSDFFREPFKGVIDGMIAEIAAAAAPTATKSEPDNPKP